MRNTLNDTKISQTALTAMESFHNEIVKEVDLAVAANKYVIVGMRHNPVVKSARKLLQQNNITYQYLEYGSYFSKWKQRLAIKLWSGWPTFPMVFVDGQLIGGCAELKVYLSKMNQ